MNMDKIKAFLTQKVAGIPVFIFVILGIAAMVFFINRTSSSSTDSTTSTDSTDDTTTDENSTVATTDTSLDADSNATTVVTETTTSTTTNEYWSSEVISWLLSQGYDHTLAEGAITNYLAGDAVTYEQNQIVAKAIAQFGEPPEGVSTVSAVSSYSGPAAKQGTPPLTHTVKGTSDNSYAQLARLYWGRSDGPTIHQLRKDNPSLTKESGFAVGTKVTIPKHTDPKYYTAKKGETTVAEIAKKNGTTQAAIMNLNPTLKWPVKIGARVQVA